MENLNLVNTFILALAVLRLSHILAVEDGPYQILDKFRLLIGVTDSQNGYLVAHNEFAKMVICKQCNSMWLSILVLVFFILHSQGTIIICLPLALSMATIIYEDYLSGPR